MAKQPKMDGAQKLQGQTTKLQEEEKKGKWCLRECFIIVDNFLVFVSLILICCG